MQWRREGSAAYIMKNFERMGAKNIVATEFVAKEKVSRETSSQDIQNTLTNYGMVPVLQGMIGLSTSVAGEQPLLIFV